MKNKLTLDDEQSSEKQSLIVDDEPSSKKSILVVDEDQVELTDKQLKEAQQSFVKSIADNGLKIFEIVSYNIKDKESRLRRNTLKAYKLNEIEVESWNLKGKIRGFVTVNGTRDIALVSTKSWILYDKDEAINKVIAMNTAVAEDIEKEKMEIDLAHEYMQDLIENKRF